MVGAELLHEPAAERFPAQVGAGKKHLVVERRAIVDGGGQRAGRPAEAVAIGLFLGMPQREIEGHAGQQRRPSPGREGADA